MTRLSSPVTEIKNHYDVIVIGSGYGGGIAASRMARTKKKDGSNLSVCLLEKGKEIRPGEYPEKKTEALSQVNLNLKNGLIKNETGMFNFHINDDISVLTGCGLGGTSLINANVSLEPEARVFDDERWPQAIRNDKASFDEGVKRAQDMLEPTLYPEGKDSYPVLPKTKAMKTSAGFMNTPHKFTPINVTFKDGVNKVGVEQNKCNNCGDCISGCNHKAKNTTLMNYLPDAKNHGAEIFTKVAVKYLKQTDDGKWLVYYRIAGANSEKFDSDEMFVTADKVFLGAGTLGSTEILLRSKANGLALSEQLGEQFTGNGDVLGFSFNGNDTINGIGFGKNRPGGKVQPVGPCITSVIDLREQDLVNQGMVIEEGSVPGALARIMKGFLPVIRGLSGEDTQSGIGNFFRKKWRVLVSFVRGPYKGALNNTQIYLVMTHDDGQGKMYLDNDRLKINWDGVGEQEIFQKVSNNLKEATKALGGVYVKNPAWTKLMDYNLITVHPLGGAIMADDAAQGVVNHKGQVFSATSGTHIHQGLYVCDGAVVPMPVGVNPLITISGLAERICNLVVQDNDWIIDYGFGEVTIPDKETREKPVGIQFTETMTGYFSSKEKDDYQKGWDGGRTLDSPFAFTLTVIAEDLDTFIGDKHHKASMVGTVDAPALSEQALTVRNGVFNLFVEDQENVSTRKMEYHMGLDAEDGKKYYFEGFKSIHNDKGFDLWDDTTTLYITLYNGTNNQSPVLGKGILKIKPSDFRKQMTTMTALNAKGMAAKLKAVGRFGTFFSKSLFDIYGGVFAKTTPFDAEAPPRQKRELKVGAPEVYHMYTEEEDPRKRVQLRLTRYNGGSKGPVMLAHGLGVSSTIFSIDTIDTNLLEYLYEHEYDVWLFDYRASILLPSATTQFSGDDIAMYDYPVAVRKIQEITKNEAIHVVAHCFGGSTFTMAMLQGLKGVKSAVISQVSAHSKVTLSQKVRCGLHLPSFLDTIGVSSLNAYTDTKASWADKLYSKALSFLPTEVEERCTNPTCHRISFMYALLYEHDQLNTATHNALHEMFGTANMESFEHLASIVRHGHLVDGKGEDVYLPHIDRFNIPVTFIHGDENVCFLPESTELTYNLLKETHPDIDYKRHIIKDYGHIDCIFGKNASKDVFPFILAHLEKF